MVLPNSLKKSQGKNRKKNSRKSASKNKENVKNSSSQKNRPARRARSKTQATDPEALALSKNDIIEFCDRVLKKWQQDPVKNARNMPAMLAVRTSVFFSDEVSLKAIWSEIISWVYQLLYENAQAQARKEGLEWAEVFSKLKGSNS